MQRSALCRSRRELSNAYLLAKNGVDTAENEPIKIWTWFRRAVEKVEILTLSENTIQILKSWNLKCEPSKVLLVSYVEAACRRRQALRWLIPDSDCGVSLLRAFRTKLTLNRANAKTKISIYEWNSALLSGLYWRHEPLCWWQFVSWHSKWSLT